MSFIELLFKIFRDVYIALIAYLDIFFIQGSSGIQKSGVLVEFADLAFHFRSPGDLTDDEFDLIINFLVERLETQERTELYNLQNFYEMLQRCVF